MEEKRFAKIGVLTSGGDSPGMNPAVRAVVRFAVSRGVEVVGIQGGYKGLIENDMIPLTARSVGNKINLGGTFLYSARCNEFKEESGMQRAVDVCRENNIDGIVVIGGDGTFRGANDLTVRGIPCIGIPGTIDNDITSTDNTIGFDTAMNTVVDLIDKLRDTSESHARCCVVEVMGRNCGYIALETGIATGAVAVVINEIEFDEEAAMKKIMNQKKAGKKNFVVVVSEGVENFALGLAERIEKLTEIETKFIRPAHIMRGGRPTLRDRLLATRMAEKAVHELLLGNSNLVICERYGSITALDIKYALTLDKMYKKSLKPGNLDNFTEQQIEEMKAVCAERQEYIKDLYRIMDGVSC